MKAPGRRGLGRRLALAFAVVAAFTAMLSAVILTAVWGGQFDAYVREGLQDTADGAATLLGRSYENSGGWTLQGFSEMPRFGMMSGLALQVLDARGSVIYDDTYHATMLGQSIAGVPSGYREPQGPVVTSPIVAQEEIVGVVRMWSLSPQGLLTENDWRFRRSSFQGLITAALISVFGASLAGLVFAMTIVRPLDKITATAERLRAGDRHARTELDGEDSIGVLGRTFDEMADAIEADREMERRLTADVAHELRTPLQAIQATVEAMQDGVMPADEEHLGTVRNETVRLARLADGILELTRLERGSTPMSLERIDLAGPVRMAVDAHRALFESCGLTLAEEIESGLMVDGDSDRLTQAVGNLISNACRYTPSGGVVTVTLGRDGDRALIEVADTGIGIAEEDLERVFSRFWRADGARDRASGGLGIGLAVVKEIVERHGGSVEAANRAGGGSVFAVRVPLAGLPEPSKPPARRR
ncbi:MAG: HAMP domain-containing sensor histidine kinase [Actinomycetota bacterium]|nr:HAMP domain-containing sensor histidine kinase [Actinomycetota bacterium]